MMWNIPKETLEMVGQTKLPFNSGGGDLEGITFFNGVLGIENIVHDMGYLLAILNADAIFLVDEYPEVVFTALPNVFNVPQDYSGGFTGRQGPRADQGNNCLLAHSHNLLVPFITGEIKNKERVKNPLSHSHETILT